MGVEESVSIENLDKSAIEAELKRLILKGEPKCAQLLMIQDNTLVVQFTMLPDDHVLF